MSDKTVEGLVTSGFVTRFCDVTIPILPACLLKCSDNLSKHGDGPKSIFMIFEYHPNEMRILFINDMNRACKIVFKEKTCNG